MRPSTGFFFYGKLSKCQAAGLKSDAKSAAEILTCNVELPQHSTENVGAFSQLVPNVPKGFPTTESNTDFCNI